jgi:Ca-activated chloride channel family protein
MTRTRLFILALFAIAASLVASGCSVAPTNSSSGPSGSSEHSGQLEVLAGSELKDVEPLLADVKAKTGVDLYFKYSGSLDGADEIASGNSNATFAWFPNSKYVQLVGQQKGVNFTTTSLMRSPVVLGVKQSVAAKFGWTAGAKVSWKDIAAKASSGELSYAMTNPTASNSGFSTLIGVATATNPGGSDAIDAGSIDAAALKAFFSGQKLTAGSSGFLADSYVAKQKRLDGIFNYESIILQLNKSGKLDEQLVPIYPTEGLVTADYPFILVDKTHKADYDKVVAYMKTPAFQAKLVKTDRRPAVPGVALPKGLPTGLVLELPFPAKLDAVQTLLTSYLDKIVRPSHTYYVLDESGSMAQDGRMDALKKAMKGLTGTDGTQSGTFTRFRNDEQVTIIPFNHQVQDATTVTVKDSDASSASQKQIRRVIDNLSPNGGTAIYSGVEAAYKQLLADQRTDSTRFYSIVLLTDGENTDGDDFGGFRNAYKRYSDTQAPVYSVLFGDGNQGAMADLAKLTGGKTFDGRGNLTSVFKEIRGYQ